MAEKVKEQIIKVLLTNKNLTKYRIAKIANASFGWTHQFLKNLEKLKLIKETKIINVEGLLDYWLKIRKKSKQREYMIQEPLEIIKSADLDYAITTYYAENIIQNYIFPSRLDFYIREEDLEKWHKLLTSKGLYGKGNVRILINNSGLFLSRKIRGLNIVCFPQLIIDLKLEGGPCEEAAEMLIKRLKENV